MSDKLEIVYLGIDQLQPLKNNPRRAKDPAVIQKLIALIREHKFQSPLQVYKEENGKYTIICGNYRYQAGKTLGMDEFPCIVYEGDRNRALARAISDNKSGEWTEFDLPKLSDLFKEIDIGDFNLPDLTGFGEIELRQIINGPDFKPASPEEQGRLDQKTPIKCPNCGHEFTP